MLPTISLAGDTTAERRTKAELEELLSTHDLSRWCFTTDVVIDENERIPHSHPVLTLNTRNRDEFLLAGYIHEQLHWFCADRRPATDALAEHELKQRYPNVPIGYPEGCRDEDSTYLHLIVCWQEHDALRNLLGEQEAAKATRQFAEVGVYRWVYRTILADFDDLGALYERRGLRVLPSIAAVATADNPKEQQGLPRGPLPAKLESHGAVFFDAADRLFLVKVTYGSGRWRFPGGVAELDEPPRATVRREVEEEIGLVKEPGALLVVDWQPSQSRNLTERQRAAGFSERFMDGLVLDFDGGVLTPEDIASIKLDPGEIEDYAFLPLDQAIQRMDSLHARRAVAAVKARETGTVVYLENGHPPA